LKAPDLRSAISVQLESIMGETHPQFVQTVNRVNIPFISSD
jgi:hypothetical protein